MKSAKTAKERLFDLTSNVMELVSSDKRSAEEVADVFQVIKERQDFTKYLRPKSVQTDFFQRQWVSWVEFYRGVFNINLERGFLNIPVPECKKGLNRLVVVAKELTFRKIVERMEVPEKFNVDINQVRSIRENNQTYAVWLSDKKVAYGDKRARKFSDDSDCISLKERLLLEMKYFVETGRRLDFEGEITLCAGSRCQKLDGVPYLYWHDDGHLGIYQFSENHELDNYLTYKVISR